jgi:hypothetical protein
VPEYDFSSLSPYDFQLLSRDLLQAELALRLESFAHGRDGGVDLRNLDRNILVQCKHFVGSRYETLLRVLRLSERPKVEKLEPDRYIVTTSQALTPFRKAEIRRVFDPFCRSEEDVYGRDDLNNLLGLYPTIEEQNFKLWLTSDVVLRRIIHAGAIQDTERAVERMRVRTRRYVQNPSFRRALDILEKRHYCIIAGIPGIGKTTLAEVLLVHYTDRHDFMPIRIGYDLAEAVDAARWDTRQVFYFDDFLGRTTLDKLRKNEDQRLLEFMADVAENPRWRFILTTREYILNRAKLRYETLSNANLDLETCVLDMRDYSTEIRAAILYNHVYFSDVETAFKRALLNGRGYRPIAFNANYNPRIVEHMTSTRNLVGILPDQYVDEFVATLDNPVRVWRHAFEQQISEAAQQLLLVLVSLPDEVLPSDLEIAYEYFVKLRRDRRGFNPNLRDFEHALKELDGNFVATSRKGEDVLIAFHNPSVEDFLRQYLSSRHEDVRDLLDSAPFFEQCVKLVRGLRGNRSDAALKNIDALDRAFRRLINAETCRVIRWVDGERILGVRHWQPGSTERVSNVVEIAESLDSEKLRSLGQQLVNQMKQHVERGGVDRSAYASLARTLVKKPEMTGVDLDFVSTIKRDLLANPSELDHFQAIIALRDDSNNLFSPDEIGTVADRFVEFCESEARRAVDEEDDAEELHSIAYSLRHCSESLGLTSETMRAIGTLESAAEDLSSQDDETPEPESDWKDEASPPRFNIDEMFEALLHDIETVDGSKEGSC